METTDYRTVVSAIVEKAKNHFSMNAGDYFDDDGCLICGTCGEKKTAKVEGIAEYVVCSCKCDISKRQKEAMQQKVREDIERINSLKRNSLMDEKFRNAYFDTFTVNGFNEKNFKICRRYVSGFDEMVRKNQGLLMWGNIGTGKSYAAACIANSLLDKGVPVIMTSFVKLFESFQKDPAAEESIIKRLNGVKLLILDDLGAERSTDYALEKVYNIVDSRYRRSLPMIVTTNVPINVMKEEPDVRFSRIYDRIFECCYPMQFSGVNWRRKEASSRFKEMESFFNES